MIKERDDTGRKRAFTAPWSLMAPGLAWLVVFFALPLFTLLRISLSHNPSGLERFRQSTPVFSWEWSNYGDAFSQYTDQFGRSFQFGVATTVLSLVIAYPLAYVIAFRGGRFKNLLLGLVVVPFFTNYLIRTLAWKTILANEGPVIGFLKDVKLLSLFHAIGLTNTDDAILRSPLAVVGGLTYNFVPFMILPIYVALEKIDPALIEAARDLYANSWRAFRKVVLPLSLPGVFAGSLLVFIPAAGDFINAYYLGDTKTTMIGNVVQNQFLVQRNYPVAAALAFVFMLIVMVMVTVYARVLGTEDLV